MRGIWTPFNVIDEILRRTGKTVAEAVRRQQGGSKCHQRTARSCYTSLYIFDSILLNSELL